MNYDALLASFLTTRPTKEPTTTVVALTADIISDNEKRPIVISDNGNYQDWLKPLSIRGALIITKL